MALPPGFSFGNPPPMQPISPFGFAGAPPIGMTMGQMMAQMQPQVPNVGFLGPGVQQIVNMAFPMIQSMMASQQMAQGMVPLGFGGGTPFQQMQAFNFQQTATQALQVVELRDQQRLIALAGQKFGPTGAEAAAGIAEIPLLGPMILQQIGRPLLAPRGLEQDITRGVLAATRGRIAPERAGEISRRLFERFGRDIPGTGEVELDPRRTGGLTAAQLGELTFEMQRRGGMTFLNEQVAGDLLSRGGMQLQGQQRVAAVQQAQVERMGESLGKVADVLGAVDQMLGGDQPISRILDAVESITGKNILTQGTRDIGQIRRQFEQLGGLADVLGVMPQALLGMAEAQAVSLRRQGLPGQLALPMVMRQAAQVSAAEAALMNLDIPGFDVTRADLARGAAFTQERMLRGGAAQVLGTIRQLQTTGALTAEQAAALRDPARLQDPGQLSRLRRDILRQAGDRPLAMSLLEDETAFRYLESKDFELLPRITAERGWEAMERLMVDRFGDPSRAKAITNALREGDPARLTPADLARVSQVSRQFQWKTGLDATTFAASFSEPSIRGTAARLRAAETIAARAKITREVLSDAKIALGGRFTIENLLGAFTGGQVDVRAVLEAAAEIPEARSAQLLVEYNSRLEAAEALEDDEKKKEEIARVQRDVLRKFITPPDVTGTSKDFEFSKEQRDRIWAAALEVREKPGKEAAEDRSKGASEGIDKLVDVLGKQQIVVNITVITPEGVKVKESRGARLNDDNQIVVDTRTEVVA